MGRGPGPPDPEAFSFHLQSLPAANGAACVHRWLQTKIRHSCMCKVPVVQAPVTETSPHPAGPHPRPGTTQWPPLQPPTPGKNEEGPG